MATIAHQRKVSMRSAAGVTLATLMLFVATDARAQTPHFTERGPYVSLMLTGAEPDGPKPTASTDLRGFRGLGLAGAVGYRWLPLRAELEYHANTASDIGGFFVGGGGDDRIALRTLMLNAMIEAQPSKWFGLFFGAGFGRADVKADFVTCLQPEGCPSPTSHLAHSSGSANARQIQLGVTLGPPDKHQLLIGFRWFRSGSLGLTNTQGQPFADDRADAKMSFVGWRGNF